jgi:hypothetical protein
MKLASPTAQITGVLMPSKARPAGIPESLDPKIDQDKDSRPDPAKDLFNDSDEEAGRSEYSSDTVMSCRDSESQQDYPDMVVEDKTDRDYMTFAFTEDITGPKYYELASPRKRKRSGGGQQPTRVR